MHVATEENTIKESRKTPEHIIKDTVIKPDYKERKPKKDEDIIGADDSDKSNFYLNAKHDLDVSLKHAGIYMIPETRGSRYNYILWDMETWENDGKITNPERCNKHILARVTIDDILEDIAFRSYHRDDTMNQDRKYALTFLAYLEKQNTSFKASYQETKTPTK